MPIPADLVFYHELNCFANGTASSSVQRAGGRIVSHDRAPGSGRNRPLSLAFFDSNIAWCKLIAKRSGEARAEREPG
jgi:hypothetical protein